MVFGSEHEAVALTLWVAHTHAFRFAECTPYLWIHSAEYASGKTRTLEVAWELVKGPVMTSSASAAALMSETTSYPHCSRNVVPEHP